MSDQARGPLPLELILHGAADEHEPARTFPATVDRRRLLLQELAAARTVQWPDAEALMTLVNPCMAVTPR
jgi:hypothetical protein